MQVWRYSLTFCEQSFLPESTRKVYIVCFLYVRLYFCLLTFKALHGLEPSYITEMLNPADHQEA